MTLPVSPPASLSFSQVNTELQLSSTTLISLNQSTVRTLAGQTTPGSQISFSQLSGKAYTVPGNSGVLTSGSSYTLPSTSGLTINILFIGGGAGGGGGSGRSSFAGFFTGGGGGGAGGNGYQTSIAVTPGQSISYSIGGGGSQGASRDGVYSSGSNGGTGGTTSVTINGTTYSCSGGSGGAVSPNASGGSAGGTGGLGYAVAPTAGSTAVTDTQDGGNGGNGYSINTTVGATTIATKGSAAAGANGPNGGPASTGVAYGGGGGGGGTCQSDVDGQKNGAQISGAGTGGAVFIWWGY